METNTVLNIADLMIQLNSAKAKFPNSLKRLFLSADERELLRSLEASLAKALERFSKLKDETPLTYKAYEEVFIILFSLKRECKLSNIVEVNPMLKLVDQAIIEHCQTRSLPKKFSYLSYAEGSSLASLIINILLQQLPEHKSTASSQDQLFLESLFNNLARACYDQQIDAFYSMIIQALEYLNIDSKIKATLVNFCREIMLHFCDSARFKEIFRIQLGLANYINVRFYHYEIFSLIEASQARFIEYLKQEVIASSNLKNAVSLLVLSKEDDSAAIEIVSGKLKGEGNVNQILEICKELTQYYYVPGYDRWLVNKFDAINQKVSYFLRKEIFELSESKEEKDYFILLPEAIKLIDCEDGYKEVGYLLYLLKQEYVNSPLFNEILPEIESNREKIVFLTEKALTVISNLSINPEEIVSTWPIYPREFLFESAYLVEAINPQVALLLLLKLADIGKAIALDKVLDKLPSNVINYARAHLKIAEMIYINIYSSPEEKIQMLKLAEENCINCLTYCMAKDISPGKLPEQEQEMALLDQQASTLYLRIHVDLVRFQFNKPIDFDANKNFEKEVEIFIKQILDANESLDLKKIMNLLLSLGELALRNYGDHFNKIMKKVLPNLKQIFQQYSLNHQELFFCMNSLLDVRIYNFFLDSRINKSEDSSISEDPAIPPYLSTMKTGLEVFKYCLSFKARQYKAPREFEKNMRKSINMQIKLDQFRYTLMSVNTPIILLDTNLCFVKIYSERRGDTYYHNTAFFDALREQGLMHLILVTEDNISSIAKTPAEELTTHPSIRKLSDFLVKQGFVVHTIISSLDAACQKMPGYYYQHSISDCEEKVSRGVNLQKDQAARQLIREENELLKQSAKQPDDVVSIQYLITCIGDEKDTDLQFVYLHKKNRVEHFQELNIKSEKLNIKSLENCSTTAEYIQALSNSSKPKAHAASALSEKKYTLFSPEAKPTERSNSLPQPGK